MSLLIDCRQTIANYLANSAHKTYFRILITMLVSKLKLKLAPLSCLMPCAQEMSLEISCCPIVNVNVKVLNAQYLSNG